MLVKLQRPPPEIRILRPGSGAVIDQQDLAPALPGERRAEHPRRAGADDDRVKGSGARHGRKPYSVA